MARIRPRRFHSQVTHCVAVCQEFADQTIGIRQVRPNIWEFVTLWAAAKMVLVNEWPTVTLWLIDHENRDNSTVMPYWPAPRVGTQVWPGKYKRPAADRAGVAPIPDVDAAVVAPRRSRQGGVKTAAPTQTVLLAPEPMPPVRVRGRAAPNVPVVVIPEPADPDQDEGHEGDASTSDSSEVLSNLIWKPCVMNLSGVVSSLDRLRSLLVLSVFSACMLPVLV